MTLIFIEMKSYFDLLLTKAHKSQTKTVIQMKIEIDKTYDKEKSFVF